MTNPLSPFSFHLSLAVTALMTLISSASAATIPDVYPVFITGYGTLSTTHTEQRVMTQLRQTLTDDWQNEAFRVTQNDADTPTSSSIISVHNCQTLFTHYAKGDEPIHADEYHAYQRRYLSCQTQAEMLKLRSSHHSFLPQPVLTRTNIRQFPAALTMILSDEQQQKIDADPTLTYHDVTSLHAIAPDSQPNTVVVKDNTGGIQRMTLVAKGDYNHDQLEDLLLTIQNSVEDGDYQSYSLYILTKTQPHGPWLLLKQFPKPNNQ